jgi:serine/threonine protein phosphatase PrpC
LLACDGIWDCKTSEEGIEEMREALKKRKSTEPISRLIEDLFERIVATDIISSAGIGTDNMTCVVVELPKK